MAKKDKYESLVNHILELLGEKDNVLFFTHCVTRLRVNVKDKGLVQTEEIERTEGVMGVQWSGEQFQIIIGSGVDSVYRAICEKHGLAMEKAVEEQLDIVKKPLTLKTVVPTL